METNDYVIGVQTSLFEELTFTQAIVYSIIKQDCEENNGVCRLNNDQMGHIIRRCPMLVSVSITALVDKNLVERDLRNRAKRLLTIVK